jgi:LuxR family transcriptional regulator, quorum-sensing system regulator CviR
VLKIASKLTTDAFATHAHLVAALESSLDVRTPQQFVQWTQGDLQAVFAHGAMIAGVGEIAGGGAVFPKKFVSYNFPLEYVSRLRRDDGSLSTPIVANWVKERRPQLFELGEVSRSLDPAWLERFKRSDLINVAAHGAQDVDSAFASYVNFSRIPGPLSAQHAQLLELVMPHLHRALVRALASTDPPPRSAVDDGMNLTAREREILHWLHLGKTNGEIAQIVGRSVNTVKHEVQNVFDKLGVINRTRAVAKAVGLGLLRQTPIRTLDKVEAL